ncbi:hypothetical protein [Paenibacillus sp. KN14-4R]|uniref:hypothetical protein n=1 Tax=Paenibacillus sp. KN14-4R TaxID=3445773 RepID=UPI003F9F12CD
MYELELDDVVAIIISICEVFESSEIVSFFVSGFGQEKWPVDCRTDLATIIEQIPNVLEKIRKGKYSFQLDFYEQGIERQLLFEEDSSLVKVTCVSRTNWIPNPSTIHMERDEVLTMFESLYKNFLEYSQVLCIDLTKNPLMADWKK